MIAPTKIYDKFPTISPAQAADLVIKAMVEQPHEINTMLGNAGAIAHTVAPKAAFRLLNMAYHVFPDSAAAKGQKAPPRAAPGRPSRSCWPRSSRASTGDPSLSRDGSAGLDRPVRVGDPAAPAARVERRADAGDLHREHVVDRGHPGAAVRRHVGAGDGTRPRRRARAARRPAGTGRRR